MATGRTVQKYSKIFMNTGELTSWSQAFGPLVWEYDEIDATIPSDSIKGYLPGQARITPTTFNWTMDPEASASYWYSYSGGPGMNPSAGYYDGKRYYTIALGIRGAPAAGDPVFVGRFIDRGLTTSNDGGLVTATMNMESRDPRDMIGYSIPWGTLLHTLTAATSVNSSTGIDQLASTSFGGYMVYHVSTANGTATIKVQDAAVNVDGSFADVTGLTTGVTDFTVAANQFGIVALGATATLRQFVRWQIVLGTATTITFVLSLVRRYGVGQ